MDRDRIARWARDWIVIPGGVIIAGAMAIAAVFPPTRGEPEPIVVRSQVSYTMIDVEAFQSFYDRAGEVVPPLVTDVVGYSNKLEPILAELWLQGFGRSAFATLLTAALPFDPLSTAQGEESLHHLIDAASSQPIAAAAMPAYEQLLLVSKSLSTDQQQSALELILLARRDAATVSLTNDGDGVARSVRVQLPLQWRAISDPAPFDLNPGEHRFVRLAADSYFGVTAVDLAREVGVAVEPPQESSWVAYWFVVGALVVATYVVRLTVWRPAEQDA